MKGKLTITSVNSFSSKSCTGTFAFKLNGTGEDPDLTDLEINISIPKKPIWRGKQL